MKFVRVNMRSKSIIEEKLPEAFMGLGGRGLTAAIISSEVPPRCDPLGPENKLVIAPGLLSGTKLVNTSRISIGAKSPLTNGIKESNAGGTAADALARLGISAVVVEEQAPEGELWALQIDPDGTIAFHDVRQHKGKYTYPLTEELFEQYGIAQFSVLDRPVNSV